MSSSFAWKEDNGAATGSPSRGTSAGNTPTNVNWKNIDDTTTAYSSEPITVPGAGTNYSFPKYQYGYISGTFTEISGGLFSAHTAHAASGFPTGVTLTGEVTSTYTTPAATNSSFGTDYTSIVAIGSGETVLFSETGPYDASPAATLTAPGYTQYLATQLAVASTCTTAGDTDQITMTLRFNEN